MIPRSMVEFLNLNILETTLVSLRSFAYSLRSFRLIKIKKEWVYLLPSFGYLCFQEFSIFQILLLLFSGYV